MFDIVSNDATDEIKYNYIVLDELDKKELLSQEKEMLGIYISGHPLDSIRESIIKNTNINSLDLKKIGDNEEESNFKDGQNVKYAGTITSVKKKYTKKNTIMAFVTVEDLYGSAEIIIFDSVYNRVSNILIEDNIILVEGRLSIKEDDVAKIVVRDIREFDANETSNSERKYTTLQIDITELDEEVKKRLRGAIKFFSGDRVNFKVQVVDKAQVKPCGAIYLTEEIVNVFKEIVGENNVEIV